MSPKKCIDATNATGIVSKSGRYGGTFAHCKMAIKQMKTISELSLEKLLAIDDKRKKDSIYE
jgi:hypothetical protein